MKNGIEYEQCEREILEQLQQKNKDEIDKYLSGKSNKEEDRKKAIAFLAQSIEAKVGVSTTTSEILDDLSKTTKLKYTIAKDPKKQNLKEKAFGLFLDRNVGNRGFYYNQLPSHGKKCYRVDKLGNLVLGAGKSGHSKSIDFLVGNRKYNLEVYISHKYIGDDDGGGQDNQFEDVSRFLQYSSFNKDNLRYFIAVCDGSWWLRDSRLNDLCAKYNNNKTRAIQISEFFDTLEKLR